MDAAALPIFTVFLLVTPVLIKPSFSAPGFHHSGDHWVHFTEGGGDGSDGEGKDGLQSDGGDGRERPQRSPGVCARKSRSNMTNTDPDAYKALQAWKSAITEDPNGVLATWVGPDVCSYWGVFCSEPPSDDGDRITSDPVPARSPSDQAAVAVIDLNGASLKGTLVDELALLTQLSTLHLNSNRFSGTFPDALASLRYLTEVDLSNNNLCGPFPSAILSLPNLAYLDLRFNNLSGTIPPDLFRKPTLDAIFLNDNLFHGIIPCNLWGSPASVVSLANNRLTGKIPSKLSGKILATGRLNELLFLNNSLSGCIPDEIGQLLQLNVLDVSNNSLTGSLPPTLGCIPGMEVLNVGHNKLAGVIPKSVCGMKSLVNLTVSFNFFSGLGEGCDDAGSGEIPGFDFTGNCVPGWGMQRPPRQCGGGVNGAGTLSSMTTKPTDVSAMGRAIKTPNGGGNRVPGIRGIPSY